MRPIKFRGLSLNGTWHYGLPTILTEDLDSIRKKGTYISNRVGVPMAYAIRPETLTEYTGLLDKNGKEIYERDIVNTGHRNIKNLIVIYRDGGFSAEGYEMGDIGINPDASLLRNCEVIGNVYEHLNLLTANT